MFLPDTNVVSNSILHTPPSKIHAWVQAQDPQSLFLCSVSVAEIEFGIHRLPQEHAADLEVWRAALRLSFQGRVLPIDTAVAFAWGQIRARIEHAGRAAPKSADLMIAACAEVYGLTVATRNTRDFQAWGGAIVNPWL
jgi:predicted nucleic acid-binding protein